MPNDPKPISFDDLPIEIDTLTALIEGDLDCSEAHRVRERLLDADPELAHRVEMMAQDRVMLRTLGDDLPPEGLDEAIIAQLEREALIGLGTGTPGTASLPVSRVGRAGQHRHRRRWLQRPAGAGLAAAALLVLAVGVVLQIMPTKPAPTPEPGPIAMADTDGDTPALVPEVAPAPTAVAADVPRMPIDAASHVLNPVLPNVFADTAPVADQIFTGDWDRALALLDEGRLLVRVRSVFPEQTHARLEPMHARIARAGEAWRLEEDVAEPLAVAMQQKFAPADIDHASLRMAADRGPAASLIDPSQRRVPRSTFEGVYLVDARRDGAAMASLTAALSLGDGQVAVFEELAEPLDLPGVFTPDAVLWWSRPASSWAERRHVPVVIERVDQ